MGVPVLGCGPVADREILITLDQGQQLLVLTHDRSAVLCGVRTHRIGASYAAWFIWELLRAPLLRLARPATQQFWPADGGIHHLWAAPVVTDQVDGFPDVLQRGCAESGRREADQPGSRRTGAVELREQQVPYSRRFGIAVDESGLPWTNTVGTAGHTPIGMVGCSTASTSASLRRWATARYSGSRIMSTNACRFG